MPPAGDLAHNPGMGCNLTRNGTGDQVAWVVTWSWVPWPGMEPVIWFTGSAQSTEPHQPGLSQRLLMVFQQFPMLLTHRKGMWGHYLVCHCDSCFPLGNTSPVCVLVSMCQIPRVWWAWDIGPTLSLSFQSRGLCPVVISQKALHPFIHQYNLSNTEHAHFR